jgi:hypothetical protein
VSHAGLSDLATSFECACSQRPSGEEGVFDFDEFNWAQVGACQVGNCTEVHGRAVQVDSIKTRVESAYGVSA